MAAKIPKNNLKSRMKTANISALLIEFKRDSPIFEHVCGFWGLILRTRRKAQGRNGVGYGAALKFLARKEPKNQ